MREAVRQLDLRMRQFRYNVAKFVETRERLQELQAHLGGVSAVAPHPERGKASVIVPRDNYILLMSQKDELAEQLAYYHHAVHEISVMLSRLDTVTDASGDVQVSPRKNDDVDFLEEFYWFDNISIRGMCEINYMSPAGVYRRRDDLLERMLETK